MAETEVCGANYGLNVGFEPLTPVPEALVVDPDRPSVDAQARKPATVAGGTYTTPFADGAIPAGTPASVTRAFHVSG